MTSPTTFKSETRTLLVELSPPLAATKVLMDLSYNAFHLIKEDDSVIEVDYQRKYEELKNNFLMQYEAGESVLIYKDYGLLVEDIGGGFARVEVFTKVRD